MRNITIFVEDYGHETVIKAIVARLSIDKDVPVKQVIRSARGGHGKVVAELKTYLRAFDQGRVNVPDLLIVATDANCKGYTERKREIDDVIGRLKDITVCAVPDPHIERWLLLDSSAFKAVLGKGCDAPDQKCSRDRYKKVLIDALRSAGVSPLFGGIEHAEDIINAMDLVKMEQDPSFGKFLKELKNVFNHWSEVIDLPQTPHKD